MSIYLGLLGYNYSPIAWLHIPAFGDNNGVSQGWWRFISYVNLFY